MRLQVDRDKPVLTFYRDNCRCPKCVNQETMQRGFNILTVSWESSQHWNII